MNFIKLKNSSSIKKKHFIKLVNHDNLGYHDKPTNHANFIKG
jgi:hypothetical protein